MGLSGKGPTGERRKRSNILARSSTAFHRGAISSGWQQGLLRQALARDLLDRPDRPRSLQLYQPQESQRSIGRNSGVDEPGGCSCLQSRSWRALVIQNALHRRSMAMRDSRRREYKRGPLFCAVLYDRHNAARVVRWAESPFRYTDQPNNCAFRKANCIGLIYGIGTTSSWYEQINATRTTSQPYSGHRLHSTKLHGFDQPE